jgi:hypothetical protein
LPLPYYNMYPSDSLTFCQGFILCGARQSMEDYCEPPRRGTRVDEQNPQRKAK